MMIIENDRGTMILGIEKAGIMILGIEKAGTIDLGEIILATMIRGIAKLEFVGATNNLGTNLRHLPMVKDRITWSVEFRGIVLRQNVFRPKGNQ